MSGAGTRATHASDAFLLEKAVFSRADNIATAKKVCAHWMTFMFRYDFFLAHSRLIG
jgi:hypothetical protein